MCVRAYARVDAIKFKKRFYAIKMCVCVYRMQRTHAVELLTVSTEKLVAVVTMNMISLRIFHTWWTDRERERVIVAGENLRDVNRRLLRKRYSLFLYSSREDTYQKLTLRVWVCVV